MGKKTRIGGRPQDKPVGDENGLPPCWYCTYLTASGGLDLGPEWKCKAFPDGINYLILDRVWRHEKPMYGDKGFRFESKVHEVDGERIRITYDGIYELV